ncbi:hypothetical protein XENOCAPTIV_023215 [Xenoophorus captivus]|uniref:DH domain-containing protein n=1 Tax=Xenoophorus captivus TaxID=1517983 RepID=A0ABV0QF23_9TELE
MNASRVLTATAPASKRRDSKLWSETFDIRVGATQTLSPKEIKRQELPCLSSYTPYCSNQVQAKALLDQKKQDRRVQDFLQRCLQSPFSRKLDLWNFLDIPRSRLVKYPLLLREILKHTPNNHPDRQHLEEAKLHVFLFQDILVITRSVLLNNQPVSYLLCRQPIPIRQLDLEDISDGEMRVGGSIRGAFSNNERS